MFQQHAVLIVSVSDLLLNSEDLIRCTVTYSHMHITQTVSFSLIKASQDTTERSKYPHRNGTDFTKTGEKYIT